MKPELTAHHTGCLTDNIEESIEIYKNQLGFEKVSEIFHIKSQEVKVCFIETGNNFFLELVEPLNKTTALYKLLLKKQNYYHMAYTVQNFDYAIDYFEKNGCKMITSFKSEAFNYKKCAFFYTSNLHMIELIESD